MQKFIEAAGMVDIQAAAYAQEVEASQAILVGAEGRLAMRQAGEALGLCGLEAEPMTRRTGDLTSEDYLDYTVSTSDKNKFWLYETMVQPSFVTPDRPFHYTLYTELARRTGGLMLGLGFRLDQQEFGVQPQPDTVSIFGPADARRQAVETIHAALMPRGVASRTLGDTSAISPAYQDQLKPVALNAAFDEPPDRRLPTPSIDLVGVNSYIAQDIPKLAKRAKLTVVLREQRDPDAKLYGNDDALAFAEEALGNGVKPLDFNDIRKYAAAQVGRAHRLTNAEQKSSGRWWRRSR